MNGCSNSLSWYFNNLFIFQFELDFVDDYERPVLEKYEKMTPTPIVKEKKPKEELKVQSVRKMC